MSSKTPQPAVAAPSTVSLPGVLTVKQLAETIHQPVTVVIAKLMGFGVLATINEDIDFDTAAIIADDFGLTATRETEIKATRTSDLISREDISSLKERPAIVTIMGHVDHGKTTLLDTIRKTNVAAGEAGGITQHISSYQIEVKVPSSEKSRVITFLDTPGHSAFEAMRRHGAQITDLVVLVVAADDGIKPQTLEAINHARQLRVPTMVAINKIDKPGADIQRVKGQLAEHDLTPEDWGGKTPTVEISAKDNVGIEDLLEMILLSTDLRELKANYDAPAVGVVVESQIKPGVGPVATVLIQNGSLHVGDFVSIGSSSGRVRTLSDHRGKRIEIATPSTPVAVTGLSSVPQFGEQLSAFDSEKEAREASRQFLRSQTAKRATGTGSGGLRVNAQKEGNKTIMNVVVKADTNGSLEAVKAGLEQMRNDDIEVRVISDGVGEISEGDISMAQTGHALVLGFQVRIPSVIKSLADREKVAVSLYNVVYELFDTVRDALAELMPTESVEQPVGKLSILAIFHDNRGNTVLGGRVEEGIMEPNRAIRLLKKKAVIGEGKILKVQRGKENVRSVATGSECGLELNLKLSGTLLPAVGDIVEAYYIEQRRKALGL